ncbi:unnamed protein product [Clonostachys byssicola]|uniref:Peptidase M43 pregnancy-associated plasma-A domain-containing protein n=1 Tax=Clonostachys byssicola TaxID=160290 RepID=A0A9N9YAZ3_9HYPO|nr:unnamed protein product [Clonostachys byssicola]
MSLKSVLFFASLALGHVIQPRSFSCQSPQLTQEQIDIAEEMSIKEKSMRKSGMTIQATISVDVWLHAISASESGLSSDSALQNQFDTLQKTFSPYNINLNYAGKTKTVNAQWANEGNGQEMPMKKALRRGNYQSMNVYIVDVLPTASGYCYYPTNAPEGSDNFYIDGCTLAKSAMGLIAAHEAGHWLGLAHTFDGNNCDGPGDYVDDTPAQSGPSSGCPASRDSCPNHPGTDPIHNYMDYTSPDCWTEFTPGQIDRVNSQWNRYRA